MANKKHKQAKLDPATESFRAGFQTLATHPIFHPLLYQADVIRHEGSQCPADGWAVVTRNGNIHVHPTRRGAPEEWAYVLAHALLHLGFGHFRQELHQREWNAACCIYIARFLYDLKLGRPPADLAIPIDGSKRTEERIFEELLHRDTSAPLDAMGVAGTRSSDMVWTAERPGHGGPFDWPDLFGKGLLGAVTNVVAEAAVLPPGAVRYRGPGERARAWFVDNYPLLGALATGFKIYEDASLCYRMQINIAAVSAEAREIYLNPAAGLDEEELRFVMAHELLHVGLRHDTRQQGRDHYLWNIACDYIINLWLVEMKVGSMPRGVLYDESLKGMSAEAVYDLLVTDMRRFRRLGTFRGVGLGDILEPSDPGWCNSKAGMDLDDFYRRALSQGLDYHQSSGRRFLPAGLVEEIRTLSVPPIPWDVELAHWFDERFPPLELRRSYARPSRRQSSTPDIPRPNRMTYPEDLDGRTFGVILDTSGSMNHVLMAKGLGAIASYSEARDVPAARVIFCDADAYDQGYMQPIDIAGSVKVRGRGGTVLQPGVDLLERAEDFPKDGPILIITDGYCEDRLHVHRDHAYLMPEGNRLPFVPKGPVFSIK